MTDTLHPTIKWIAHTLMPAFGVGSGLLIAGVQPNTFGFWWAVVGAIVGGLAGKTITVSGDHAVAKGRKQGE